MYSGNELGASKILEFQRIATLNIPVEHQATTISADVASFSEHGKSAAIIIPAGNLKTHPQGHSFGIAAACYTPVSLFSHIYPQ
jgi:hypothetical protein